ncbi:deoxyribose-phosphate aldolase [Neocallimastix californiae]|jgi:deoxyribose-phosphate aldolase|uniref:deoxyribose-phosphate aldolase n=1 Tax=Neocallimastix californiae TaxID=1754190 RepID=A0A1Y2EQ92_9FUNG|nr:deoxyribose-phosphate aldolase [Neocallimastix californiae]|eukprot:ORY73719.1 deoxyribose-phosphate aldolase [Neocallimastix californiae]
MTTKIVQKANVYIEAAKANAKISKEICNKAIASLDLTSLNDNDTDEVIKNLCNQARSASVPTASVCVYPQFVKLASTELKDTDISIATVINFPKGEDTPKKVYDDTVKAIVDGADEIDVVWDFKAYMQNDVEKANEIIKSCRKAIDDENVKNNGNVLLKVILETGALSEMQDQLAIYNASIHAITNGANFIKTSTGKIAKGASLEAAAYMLLAIAKTYNESKKTVGLKVSGGVRSCEQASQYMSLFNEVLSKEINNNPFTIKKNTFRIGASGLFKSLVNELKNY